LKDFSRRDTCTRYQRSPSVADEEPSIIEGILEKRIGEAPKQLAQEGQEQRQLQANIEFFECKKGLLFMTLFDASKTAEHLRLLKVTGWSLHKEGEAGLLKQNVWKT